MSRSFKLSALVVATGLLFAGCTSGMSNPPQASAGTMPAKSTSVSTVSVPGVFAELDNGPFTFASGAGGWSTTINIAADGSFTGQYNDTDMGDTGSGYPNGTRYVCQFSGQFALKAQVDDFEYTLTLVNLTQQGTPNDTTIESDGYRYIVSTPYGFDDAQDFSLYRVGHPVDTLPPGFVDWMRQPMMLPDDATTLPFWGLYNITGDQGFFG